MENAYSIIQGVRITEKAEDSKITFLVDPKANKIEIAKAVKTIFAVRPKKVNVITGRPKNKRVGKYMGTTSAYKKAVITLSLEDGKKMSDNLTALGEQ